MSITTMAKLLAEGADAAIALSAPGRPDLTYGGLRALTRRTRNTLNAAGIGRNDRIAIVLPNGPEMAAGFVALANCAAIALFNFLYCWEEFVFYSEFYII